MRTKSPKLPTGASKLATRHPAVWESFAELGECCAEAGPLDVRTRHLVKLALATGAGLEGAVHSHARRALSEGVTGEEIRHIALLAIPTLGLSTAVRAMTWMDDITDSARPTRKVVKKRRASSRSR
ncbi:MAG: carboxymuconolactone decarboxylase family protein [Alphaproteobacteria bacterium]|nr:carboxymuconolactone decarboxylase family protein [Alphaproteobacteria bacterium]MDE2111967.1 carboxymuconolactone decarboxylase family protein [Alphaproteobacteria bacterium]MDE2492531.1 carboxymuconolactone decarboxylase family protein [Alphaproteobacteria bacterium]